MNELTMWQKIKTNLSFRGPDGIRAGWSIAIFFAVLAAILGVFAAFRYFVLIKLFHLQLVFHGEIPPQAMLFGEMVQTAFILGATYVMARIEGRSLWDYGLASRRTAAHFCAGWVGGFLCLSILAAVLVASGHLVFDGIALHGLATFGFGVLWLFIFMLVGFSEENMLRGYLLSTLAKGIGFWPAAAVTSLLFSAGHLGNPGENGFGIATVFLAGMIFCLLLRVSGSLWLGIGFHVAWDWAQSFLYGTPDSAILVKFHYLISHATGNAHLSGGAAGPEGSYLLLPVLVPGLLVLIALWRRMGLFTKDTMTAS